MKTNTPYLVLARKYRPGTFDEVIGQEAIGTTLKNAIASNRLAHAYLFAGPRGIGKTSMARILAKAMNCLSAPLPTAEPCGACASCLAITRGNDLDAIEFDAASNRKVEEIQTLILDHVDYPPARSRFKIYIIDEVQQLSDHAFDSLLKTLEEPPPHVRFIFATTHPGKVPPTIHSRCQRFDFRRLSPERLAGHLKAVCEKEGARVPEAVLRLVARSAEGGVRDALSMLDQVIALGGAGPEAAAALIGIPPDEANASLLDAVLAKDLRKGFEALGQVWERGWDLREFSEGFLAYVRDHLVVAAGDREALAWRYAPEVQRAIEARAASRPVERWMTLMDRAVSGLSEVRDGLAGRLALELLFLGMLGEGSPSEAPATGVPLTAPVQVPAPVRAAEAPASLPPPPSPKTPAVAQGGDWEAVISQVGQKRMSLAAMLRGTRLASTEGGIALVQLPAERSVFDLEKLNEAEKRSLVEETLSCALGRPVKVRYEIVRDATATLPSKAPERTPAQPASGPAPANDPLVALANKLLGGRVIRRPPPD
jgi:DNA polymerase-3 subunit gamma/tau